MSVVSSFISPTYDLHKIMLWDSTKKVYVSSFWVNPFGATTGIFWKNKVNIMAADA